MKLKNTYVLTEIGDDVIAAPVGETADTSRHVIRLNETAADIWHGLEQEKTLDDIAADLVEKYDGIDHSAALEHVKKTVATFIDAGIVE